MDWGVLIVVGIAVWLTAAVAVGLLLGRIIRRRDQEDPVQPPVTGRSDTPGE